MLAATVAFFWPEGMNGLTFAEKQMDHSKNFSSLDLVYESKDGFITLSTVSDKEWQALCAALKRDDLLTDKRFATAIARRENTKERRAIVGAEIEQHPTRELLELLDSHDVPCAPLLNREELLNHPQILESNTIAREIIPGFGEVRQPVPAAQFQLTQSSLRIPAPKLGQHSSEILEELGYSPANCAELINANVIVQA
jgi:crotonobetainyl-CoA:carnitine CoA-transferase CaiB-like acyl-CoA transferase